MPVVGNQESRALVGRARIALGRSQKELGAMCGASLRSAHRWEGGASTPSPDQFLTLARAVFPVDEKLSGDLARRAGSSLLEMGLVQPPAPSPVAAVLPPPAPAAPPTRPFPPVALMLDSVLVAASDGAESRGLGGMPRAALREVLRAAFARAKALGLTLDEVNGALAVSDKPAAKKT
jgi:transcriptional regulator with XRE-family HTH domain